MQRALLTLISLAVAILLAFMVGQLIVRAFDTEFGPCGFHTSNTPACDGVTNTSEAP